VIKQLDKLIDVIQIEQLSQSASVQREMVLVKVQADASKRTEVTQIAEIFRAKIVDVSTANLSLELTGQSEKIEAFIKLLEPFPILQTVRTGLIALPRG
jgi:acetolactate synthase-1/3 small subunit